VFGDKTLAAEAIRFAGVDADRGLRPEIRAGAGAGAFTTTGLGLEFAAAVEAIEAASVSGGGAARTTFTSFGLALITPSLHNHKNIHLG